MARIPAAHSLRAQCIGNGSSGLMSSHAGPANASLHHVTLQQPDSQPLSLLRFGSFAEWAGKSFNRSVLLLIAGTVLVRIALASWLPLGVDESYEVATSRVLAASAFDHPPMVFWLTRLGIECLGESSPLAPRLPFILLFAGTTWFMCQATAICMGRRAGFLAGVLLNCSALFGVAIGSWALPDGPLLFALSIALFAMARGGVIGSQTCETGAESPARAWSQWSTWLLIGAALGVAALSKYHAMLAAIGLLVMLLSSRGGRRMLAHPAPWVGAVLAVVIATPVLYWNWQNDWVSLRFQGARASGGGGINPMNVLAMIGGQAVFVLPWIWWPLLVEGYKSLRGEGVDGAQSAARSLAIIGLIPIIVFSVIPLWGSRGLPHWASSGYFFLFPVLALAAVRSLDGPQRVFVRRWLAFSLISLSCLVPMLVSQASFGWLQRLVPALRGVKDPTLEALPWTQVQAGLLRVQTLLQAQPLSQSQSSPRPFLAALGWRDAGKLGVAAGSGWITTVLGSDPRNFAFQIDPSLLAGRDCLLFAPVADEAQARALAEAHFERHEVAGEVELTRAGVVVTRLRVLRCISFRGKMPWKYGLGVTLRAPNGQEIARVSKQVAQLPEHRSLGPL